MKKTRQIIAVSILAIYVGLLLLAGLHTHNSQIVSFHFHNQINSSSENAHDPFLDDQANCKLVQFSRTNYSFSENSASLVNISIEDDFFYRIDLASFHESTIKFSNQLRAPPSV